MFPRRTVQELLTLHELNPELSDVFTEGPSDRGLIRWFLDDLALGAVAVYDISVIDLPADAVAALGQRNNNRGRVITLALSCATLRESQIVCIIDRDFDRLLGRAVPESPLLLTTDYSCTEMYAYNTKALNKFIRIHKNNFQKPADTVLAELRPLLHALFGLRAANEALAWKLQAVDWTKSAKATNAGVAFDLDDHIGRYLLRNGRMRELDRFRQAYDELSGRMLDDQRHYINGEDFWTAIEWYLKNHSGGFHLKGTDVRDALFAVVEHEALCAESLFAELKRRLAVPEAAI